MSAPSLRVLDELAEQRAWQRGSLTWLMLAAQRSAYAALRESSHAVFVVLCSRRWGKTRFACLAVWMLAIARPGSIIRYAAPTKLHGRQFVRPAMQWIERSAPEYLRPRFISQDNTWIWPNGSVCHLGSCETDADVDAQVGTECHLAFVDEAGKIGSSLLRKLIRSVIMPQFLTTRGRAVVLGTPPDTPEHYLRDLVTQAAERRTLVTHTIDDCTHLDAQALAELEEELGAGLDSEDAQRELYCRFITDSTRAIIPDFTTHREAIVAREPVRAPLYDDLYVAADFGFRDLTMVLFGYLDFDRARLVVQRELVMRGKSSLDVGDAVKSIEAELWRGRSPTLRVVDAPLQQVADLAQGSGVQFAPVVKYDADAALNYLRRLIARHRIEIDPSCVTLISHLEYGIWNERKTDYERTETHHWDGIDALKYMVRHVDWTRAPFDPLPRGDDVFVVPGAREKRANRNFVEQWRRG